MSRCDVLVVAALKEELDAFLDVTGGADAWTVEYDADGFPSHRRIIKRSGAVSLEFAAAWSGAMGETAAADRARALIDRLGPGCLAMCGICAGRKGDVFLGDVIIGDRLFSYDHGKAIAATEAHPERFLHEIQTYNLRKSWAIDAAYDAADLATCVEWKRLRPPTLELQRRWLLRTMLLEVDEGEPPAERHPDRDAACPSWEPLLLALEGEGLVSFQTGELGLTDTGLALAKRIRLLSRGKLEPDPDFRVHVGPIATVKAVQQDPSVFERIATLQRKVIGIEMETAAIGYVADAAAIPALVVKGVSDYGDHVRDPQFRRFSAEAAARILLAFVVRRYRAPRGGASTLATNEASPQVVAPLLQEHPVTDSRRSLVGFAIDVSGSMQESFRNSTGGYLTRFDGVRRSVERFLRRAPRDAPKKPQHVACFAYCFGLQGIGVADLFTMLRLGAALVDRAQVDSLTRKYESQARARYAEYAGVEDLAKKFGLGSYVDQYAAGIRAQAERQVRQQVIAEMRDTIQARLQNAGDTTLSPDDAARLWQPDQGQDTDDLLYGDTPMCAAMEKILERFEREAKKGPSVLERVLFVVSDGDATDGDPRPFVKRMRENGVVVVSCYLTNHDISDPRTLVTQVDGRWEAGAAVMFEMASVMDEDSDIARFLRKKQWSVPHGSRYFVQINHSVILEELMEAAVISGDQE